MDEEKEVKTCEVCGKLFTPYRPQQTCCSPECRYERKLNNKARIRALAAQHRVYDERERKFNETIAAADAAGMSYGQYVIRQKLNEQKGGRA